jgi:hypothetical protein
MDGQLVIFGTDVMAWASSQEDPWGPIEDWDLILAHALDGEILLQLASDLQCPKRDFFLHCLHILVGDYVRVLLGGRWTPPSLDNLLLQAVTNENPAICTWSQRSRDLVAHPETFDYDFWCNGGFARNQATREP